MTRVAAKSKRILVVDDDPDVRQYAVWALEEAGYEVVEAALPVLPSDWRAAWDALALAGLGAVVYLAALSLLAPQLLRQIVELVRAALSRREAAPPPAPGGLAGTAS